MKLNLSQLWPWRTRTLQEEMQLSNQLSTPIDGTLVTNTMLLEFLRERRSDRRWQQTKRLLFTAVILGGFAVSIYTALRMTNSLPPSPEREYRVGTVTIKGVIGSGSGSAEVVLPAIRKAFEDKKTEVVLLRIDSPGGSPSEAERIYVEVQRLKEKHHKSVEAVIDNMGASAAYLIAIHTDRITASQYSLVGSVGAIMHTWNAGELADKIGVFQQAYASGSLKDMGNPTRIPTALEKQKGLALVSGIADIFAKDVAAQRGDRLKIDHATLTTGEAWSGQEAKGYGLVDDLGTLEAVLSRLDSKARNFGPFPNSPFGDSLASWPQQVGAALMDGALSSLSAQMKSNAWRAE